MRINYIHIKTFFLCWMTFIVSTKPSHAQKITSVADSLNYYLRNEDYNAVIRLGEPLFKTDGEYERNQAAIYSYIAYALGTAYLNKTNFERAITFLKQHHEVESRIGLDTENYAFACNNLGNAFLIKGDLIQAAPLIQESIQVFESIQADPELIFGVYVNLARVYRITGELESERLLIEKLYGL